VGISKEGGECGYMIDHERGRKSSESALRGTELWLVVGGGVGRGDG